jgi:hypothetical protein
MPKDERLKNFTVKRDLMELLIKMFNLDISQIKIKEIPKGQKR